MKKTIHLAPVLFTLLILAAGLSLPRFADMLLEQHLERKNTELENKGVSLTLSSGLDLFETLNLFSRSHTNVKLSDGYNMTAAEAASAAMDIMSQLAVSDKKYDEPLVTAFLVTSLSNSSAPGLSGVFWQCLWFNNSVASDVLWIDDRSGKMVSLRVRIANNDFAADSAVAVTDSDTTIEPSYDPAADAVLNYCRKYYQADDISIDISDESDDYIDYTITLFKNRDRKDKIISIPLQVKDGWLYFNF